MACTAGAETNEIPATDHECMHIHIATHSKVCYIHYITRQLDSHGGKILNGVMVINVNVTIFWWGTHENLFT